MKNRFAACRFGLVFILGLYVLTTGKSAWSQEELTDTQKKVIATANQCRDEVTAQLEGLLKTNKLNIGQLFDTFYIPIPNTAPQKYSTQYDKQTDMVLRLILDSYLEKNKKFIFVIAIDKNGYVPTHNSKYSRPLTGNPDIDAVHNRTKRIFNDRTGLAAAKNTKDYLIQEYNRDTGEKMADVSVPIFIEGKHWGAIRIGYQVD